MLANECIQVSREDAAAQIPSKKCQHCLTIEMGQNLGLPNMAAEQVGDTYFMTPITILLFGVNDNCLEGGSHMMNVYVWHEKDGKQGANNIAWKPRYSSPKCCLCGFD